MKRWLGTVTAQGHIIIPANLWAKAGITRGLGLIVCGLAEGRAVFGRWGSLDARTYPLMIGCSVRKDGRVVVPRDVHVHWRLRAGDRIEVQIEPGSLTIRPAASAKQQAAAGAA